MSMRADLVRDQFLKDHWSPFPEPYCDGLHGKIIELCSSEFSVIAEEQVFKISFDQVRTIDGRDGIPLTLGQSLSTLFQVGDVVSFSSQQGSLRLLAPSLLSKEEFARISSILPPKAVREWSAFQEKIRKFFFEHNFLELTTPTQSPCPGTEPAIDFFSVQVEGKRKYLVSSPELHLKKYLALYPRKIFEVKNVFRAGEIGESHLTEFSMLEWYRPFASLDQIIEDMRELIIHLGDAVPSFRVVTVSQLFKENLKIEINPEATLEDWRNWNEMTGEKFCDHDSLDDLFFRLFVGHIEPRFDRDVVTIVRDYPPFQAAYARIGAHGWAQRFEVYWRGLELGNAFYEVNDPELQKNRMLRDLEKRQHNGKSAIDLDEGFFLALRSGFPPTAGIAVGVERLYAAIYGIHDLKAVRPFAY